MELLQLKSAEGTYRDAFDIGRILLYGVFISAEIGNIT